MAKAIAERGSYIGFTSAVLIGAKYDRRIEGIKEGIREAGADPDQLKTIGNNSINAGKVDRVNQVN